MGSLLRDSLPLDKATRCSGRAGVPHSFLHSLGTYGAGEPRVPRSFCSGEQVPQKSSCLSRVAWCDSAIDAHHELGYTPEGGKHEVIRGIASGDGHVDPSSERFVGSGVHSRTDPHRETGRTILGNGPDRCRGPLVRPNARVYICICVHVRVRICGRIGIPSHHRDYLGNRDGPGICVPVGNCVLSNDRGQVGVEGARCLQWFTAGRADG